MPGKHRFRIRVGEDDHEVTVVLSEDGASEVQVGERRFHVHPSGHERQIVREEGTAGQWVVDLDRDPLPGHASVDGIATRLAVRTAQMAAAEDAMAKSGAGAAGGAIHAPMPGRVVRVTLEVGQTVAAGDPAVIMEAMKMENELAAPIDGVVKQVLVSVGDTVDAGQLLCEVADSEVEG